MRFMLTLYQDERQWAEATHEDLLASLAAYDAFGREVEAADAFVAGDGLQPVATATTVRVRDGEPLETDGPFAETKEQLGGFYVLECKDRDAALRWAAKVPTATLGSVEVRPVMDYDAIRAGRAAGAETAAQR